MRDRIVGELGAELYDAYGLTETYGPGTGTSCSHRAASSCGTVTSISRPSTPRPSRR